MRHLKNRDSRNLFALTRPFLSVGWEDAPVVFERLGPRKFVNPMVFGLADRVAYNGFCVALIADAHRVLSCISFARDQFAEETAQLKWLCNCAAEDKTSVPMHHEQRNGPEAVISVNVTVKTVD